MARYRYQAIDPQGRAIAGATEAASEAEAVAAIRARGQWITEIREAGAEPASSARRAVSSTAAGFSLAAGSALDDGALALVFRELAALLKAGAPLDRALAILVDLAATPRGAAGLRRAREAVQQGQSLAQALRGARLGLSEGHLGLIGAGEAGGALAETSEQLAALLGRSHAMRSALRTALVYPAIVFSVAMVAIGFLALVVLPSFQSVFASAGRALPGAAAVLVDLGVWARVYGASAAAGLGLAGLILAFWARTPAGAVALSHVALSTPVVGPIARALDAARFCRTLSLLLRHGVTAVKAAEHSVAAMSAPALRAAASRFAQDLGQGVAVSEAIARSGAFSSLAANLARIGEEAGALPEMLAHAAEIYEAEAERRSARSVQLVVPSATIVLGALIASVIVSMMTALLSINDIV